MTMRIQRRRIKRFVARLRRLEFIRITLVMFVAGLFGAAVWLAVGQEDEPLSYAGLEFGRMTPAAAGRTPWLTTGGAVVKVAKESPAAETGLRSGDVVWKIDGIPIVSARHASGIIRQRRGGEQIEIIAFRVSRGEVYPRKVLLKPSNSPPPARKLSVRPPRTLEKKPFKHPPMVANASWGHRIAKGATIKPISLQSVRAGQCSGFAPAGWNVTRHDQYDDMLHIEDNTLGSHAIYKSGRLEGQDPQSFIRGFLDEIFGATHILAPVQRRPFEFSFQGLGSGRDTGFVVYRATSERIALWAVLVPVTNFERKAVAGAVVFTLRCEDADRKPVPLDPVLVETAISRDCRAGRCDETDLAATYLSLLQRGYVHNSDGEVFLVNPRRDLWESGAAGPGFYKQNRGVDEKLEPGRTN